MGLEKNSRSWWGGGGGGEKSLANTQENMTVDVSPVILQILFVMILFFFEEEEKGLYYFSLSWSPTSVRIRTALLEEKLCMTSTDFTALFLLPSHSRLLGFSASVVSVSK